MSANRELQKDHLAGLHPELDHQSCPVCLGHTRALPTSYDEETIERLEDAVARAIFIEDAARKLLEAIDDSRVRGRVRMAADALWFALR